MVVAVIALYFLIFQLKGAEVPYFVGIVMLNALLVLSRYVYSIPNFYHDFSRVLRWFMIFSLCSFPVMLFASPFLTEVVLGYSQYFTLGYIFWFSPVGGPDIFSNLRMTGMAWEPGIWQMLLNINLLFALYQRRSAAEIFASVVATFSTFSTTGILVTAAVLCLYFFYLSQRLNIKYIVTFGMLIFLLSPWIAENFAAKLSGQHMGSGATRLADFFTGAYVLGQNPIFGADKAIANASNNDVLVPIKTFFWRGNFTDGAYEAYLSVPNSNGYMIFFMDWGLPLGLFFMMKFLTRQVLPSRKLQVAMFAVILISMSAEAISRTSFFYFFIFLCMTFESMKTPRTRIIIDGGK